MKKMITTLAVAALAILATAPLAEARSYRSGHSSHTYVSGYRSCGTPIYTERYVRYYSHCGTPVWGYRTVSHTSRYHYVAPRPRYHSAPVCPPPRYYNYSGRSGVTIHGSFRL